MRNSDQLSYFAICPCDGLLEMKSCRISVTSRFLVLIGVVSIFREELECKIIFGWANVPDSGPSSLISSFVVTSSLALIVQSIKIADILGASTEMNQISHESFLT